MKREELESRLFLHATRAELEREDPEAARELAQHPDLEAQFAEIEAMERALQEGGRVPMPNAAYFDAMQQSVLTSVKAPPAKSVRKQPQQAGILSRLESWLARPIFVPAIAIVFMVVIGFGIWQQQRDEILTLPANPATAVSVDSDDKAAEQEDALPPPSVGEAAGTDDLSSSAENRTQPAGVQNPLANAPATKLKKERTAEVTQKPDESRERQQKAVVDSPPLQALSTQGQRSISSSSSLVPQKRAERLRQTPPRLSKALSENDADFSSSQIVSRAGAFADAQEDTDMDSYIDVLRRQRRISSIAGRIKLWEDFLSTADGAGKYRAHAVYNISELYVNAADSSGELLQLADAFAWMQKHERVLKPFMGPEAYNRRSADLQTRLNRARVTPEQ